MKRLITLASLLLAATIALADDKKADDFNTTRDFRNKVFEIQNRDPHTIAQSIRLLGSGFRGADINVNDEMKTITIRDFPENIAAIEEAIKRLDRPAPEKTAVELKISVLIGSKGPLNGTSAIPEELEPVVKQLQSTLRYSKYGLMTAVVQRTRSGSGIDGSGVAEPTLLGLTPHEERPIFYNYDIRDLGVNDKHTIDIGQFKFAMRVPVDAGNGVQYQSIGFETPVSIREKEKVVIGTTTMGEKALIVVVTANVLSE